MRRTSRARFVAHEQSRFVLAKSTQAVRPATVSEGSVPLRMVFAGSKGSFRTCSEGTRNLTLRASLSAGRAVFCRGRPGRVLQRCDRGVDRRTASEELCGPYSLNLAWLHIIYLYTLFFGGGGVNPPV